MSSSSGDAGGELAERPEPSPETPSGGSVLRRGVILGLLLLVPLQLALPQVADPDLWWHLAAGRWIWAHGALPAHDPFSQHGADAPWAVYSWLFELALYGLYSLGGLLLIAVAHGLATTGIALGCLRLAHRFGRTWPETLGATAVACLTAGAVLTPRPWLCSIAFTLVLFELVFAARAGEGSRRLFAIPPLFALWANLHIQFVYGLLLLACFGLDALWERRAGRVEREYVRRLIAVGLLAGVATLLTPYHLRLYDEVWTYTGQATIYPLIQELQPFALDSELAWLALGGALTSAAVLSRGRVKSPLALGLYALALAFTLRMRRDVWLLAVVSACVVAGFGRPGARGPRGYSLTPRLLGAALGTFLLGAVASFPLAGATPAALDDAVAARYPVAAAAHVREHAYPGPLYNHFDQGGYLIWALPGYPVAMDGRTNVHGAARVARAAESWRALPGWDADPELLAAGVVIAPLAQPLTARLREDPRFRAVFEGPVSAVFVRR